MLSREQITELTNQVVTESRNGMRVVIGDRGSKQYDRADDMARYIDSAVRRALVRCGHATEEDAERR